MTHVGRSIIVAALFAGSLGTAVAQQQQDGAEGGNLNSTGDLAGKSYKGSSGGAKTSPIGSGPQDGASSGLKNTTGDLAGAPSGGSSQGR